MSKNTIQNWKIYIKY